MAAEQVAPAAPQGGHRPLFTMQPLSLGSAQDECEALRATCDLVRQVLERSSSDQVSEAEERATAATALFVARERIHGSGDATVRRRWPLSRCAAACGVSLFQFLRELPIRQAALEPFLQQHGLSWAAVEANSNLKAWQNSLISTALISRKYKDLATRYFQDLAAKVPDVLRVGWLLFLVLKAQLLPPFPDLVSCMSLLACVVNLLVAHTPELSARVLEQRSSSPEAAPVDLLKVLCGEAKVDPASAAQHAQQVDSLLLHQLPSFVEQWRHEGHEHPAAATVTTSCSYFEGLLVSGPRLEACIAGLEHAYSKIYSQQGEIDERDYLFQDCTVPASPRLSPRSCHNTAKRVHLTNPDWASVSVTPPPARSDAGRSGGCEGNVSPSRQSGSDFLASHARTEGGCVQPDVQTQANAAASPVARGTPVSEALAAAAWLRARMGPASTVAPPPPQLQAALEVLLGAVQASAILRRGVTLAEVAMPNDRPRGAGPGVMGFPSFVPSLTAVRRTDAVRLYFSALQAMLAGEVSGIAAAHGDATSATAATAGRRRTFDGSFSPRSAANSSGSAAVGQASPGNQTQAQAAQKLLFSSAKFHKALLACCLEVVVAAFRITTCTFPCMLDRLGLQPFDFLRIVQPFIRHIPDLPYELKCHLLAVEERIIEALAWMPGSPLYQLLAKAASSPTSPSLSSAAVGFSPVSMGAPAVPTPGQFSGSGSPACDPPAAFPPSAGAPEQALLPSAVGLPPRPGCSSLLLEFLYKVSRLMSFRLALLIDGLPGIDPLDHGPVHAAVRRIMDHALYRHTHLMYNRHIDQVMLCALYSYCRVQKLDNVLFKDILIQYQCQPQATHAVFRTVNLEQSNPGLVPTGQADIIVFYNQVFVPTMRSFLLQLQPEGGIAAATMPASPQLQPPSTFGAGVSIASAVTAPMDVEVQEFSGTQGKQGQMLARCLSCPASRCEPRASGRAQRVTVSCDGSANARTTEFQITRLGQVVPLNRPSAPANNSPSQPDAGQLRGGAAGAASPCGGAPALLNFKPECPALQAGAGSHNRPKSSPRAKGSVSAADGCGRSAWAVPPGLAALLLAVESAEAEQPHQERQQDEDDRRVCPASSASNAASPAHGGEEFQPLAAGHTSPDSEHSTFYAGSNRQLPRCTPA